MKTETDEVERVRERYERRKRVDHQSRYSRLNPANYMAAHEKERALVRWIVSCGISPVEDKRVLEIGCGSGGNLLDLIRLGFRPENLVANELLEERAEAARRVLPAAVEVLVGDASELALEDESFDVVLQSTVFTSILDDAFQRKLADRIWSLAKPGGGVLWYDFVIDNPSNPDVRGMPVSRIRELFPAGRIARWRLTLAPPVSRRVAAVHPAFYTLFNALPVLRTHVLCWIRK